MHARPKPTIRSPNRVKTAQQQQSDHFLAAVQEVVQLALARFELEWVNGARRALELLTECDEPVDIETLDCLTSQYVSVPRHAAAAANEITALFYPQNVMQKPLKTMGEHGHDFRARVA